MGEMTIRNIDEALLVQLQDIAQRRGGDPSELVRDVLTYWVRASPRSEKAEQRPLTGVEQHRRAALLQELREIRAMTLKPLAFDSTLIIREMRDADE